VHIKLQRHTKRVEFSTLRLITPALDIQMVTFSVQSSSNHITKFAVQAQV